MAWGAATYVNSAKRLPLWKEVASLLIFFQYGIDIFLSLSAQGSRVEVAVYTATCTERDMNVYACHMLIGEAGIESLFDGLLVEFLTYEDKFLHSVAIDLVPVALQFLVIGKHLT